ncbi:MAG: alkaline phosphatase family protein [Candidatus Njordarchaeia archaeon]
MAAFLEKVREIERSDKILLGLIFFSFIVGYVVFYIYTLSTNIREMEANLMALDIARSSLLFILDNVLIIFLMFFPPLLLIYIYLHVKLRKMALAVLIIFILASPMLFSGNIASVSAQSSPEKPLAKVVFVITFDGARYDVFWKKADFIIEHRDEGTWAEKIVVTYPTITYPNHVSLFTGTWPQIHQTQNNPSQAGFGARSYASSLLRHYHKPVVDDVFKIASRYGYKTALFSAPSTLANILGDNTTDRITEYESVEMMDHVLSYLDANVGEIKSRGLLAFIHLVDTDENLHRFGVDSVEYGLAMERNAEQVSRLYNKIFQLGLENETAIIVLADHGGIDRSHHNVWPPMVAEVGLWMWGRPFKKGYQLGGGRIVDIAPTVSYILGIPKPKSCIGVALYTAFNDTVIQEIRDENINLVEIERGEIRRAYGSLLGELFVWYTVDLAMIWAILILIKVTLADFGKFKRAKRGGSRRRRR